jgi:dienelactone hydrolase
MIIKLIAGVFLASLLAAGPAHAAPQASPDYEARAREILSEMAAGHFDKVEAQYSAPVAAALPPGKLAAAWSTLQNQAGAFQKINGSSLKTVQDMHSVTLACAFEHATLDAVIAFDKDGHIVGLRFVPHQQPVDWKAPSYVLPDAFQEQPVTVVFSHWNLPGTLSMPKGDGPFPAVVLVQGSGPQDEDETIGPNKPFKDIAWGLASRGVAVLRYVKRTKQYGDASSDDPAAITVNDETISDARAAVSLLAAQPKIDAKRIYLLGHSLGAYLGPRIASGDPQIAGLILLAGNTRPIEKLVVEQVRHITSQPGVDPAQAQKQVDAAEKIAADIDRPDLKPGDMVDVFGAKVPGSYWLDLRGYDPAALAAKLPIPMLILQGERDYQVRMADFEGWKKALAGRSNVTFKSYPALYHLFIAGSGPSTPAEYEQPGHVSEEVIADVAGWIARGPKEK